MPQLSCAGKALPAAPHKRAGLSVSLLSQIERAESSASVSSLFKIANALDVPISELFGDDEERQQPTITQLEAIERAQRDTITALEIQTNQLLRPEQRY